VELYKKLWLFVPQCNWDVTCPRPSDEVLAMVENERADKQKQKQVPKASMLVAAAVSTKTKKAATAKKKRAAPTKDTSSKKPKEAAGRMAKKQSDSNSD
jgi:hypothetical protein